MANTKKYVQIPTSYLSGSGVIIGAVNIVVNTFVDIYGNTLTMSDFGDTGYGTIEPDTNNEESFTFTSVTANANGTTTLGGVSSTLAKSPYTAASGLVRQHSGGTKIVVSDTAAFWNTFANKNNDELITGLYTFTQTPVGLNPGAITDASTTAIGIERISYSPNRTLGTATITIASPGVVTLNNHGLTLSDRVQFTTTGALPTGLSPSTTYYVIAAGLTANNFQLAATQLGTAINTSGGQSGVHTLIKVTPVSIADTDPRVAPNNAVLTTGSANAYVATLTFPITAYTPFQIYAFKANFANTGSATVAYNGLAALTLKKLDGTTNLIANDIANGMIVQWVYDGTNAIMLNPVANAPAGTKFGGTGADGALNVTSGTTTIDLTSANYITKNYTSINVSAGATLAFSNPAAGGTVIQLRSQGNVTIAGTVDASGTGTTGGTAVTGTNAGIAGTAVSPTILLIAGGATGGGAAATGGGGAGATPATNTYFYLPNSSTLTTGMGRTLIPGTGGGSGASNGGGGTSGTGGRGGGALYIECGGTLNFTGTINVSGLVGGNGSVATVGGGGGGGAGTLLVLYNSLTANSGTVTNNSGAGGTGLGGGNCGGGGGGASALGTGGVGGFNGGAPSSPTNGGGGGGGGGASGLTGGSSSTSSSLSLITVNSYFS